MVASIPRLRRYARALVGERAAADDLVQDTLARGWEKMALWQRGTDMRSWLFGIMHNLHIDHVRSRRSRPVLVSVDDEPDVPVRAAQVDGLEARDLEAMLQALPREQREVLLLVALEGMSYQEIATVLSIPVGTVMSRLARGRESLRLRLGRPAKAPLRTVK